MTGSGAADEAGGHNLDLLARSSRSFREICRFLKSNEKTNKKLRDLYNRWEAHCILVSDHTARIRSAVDPNNELIVRILDRFESAAACDAHKAPSFRYSRLQELNERWESGQNQDSSSKLELARQCLNFGPSPELADDDEFTEALGTWEDEVRVRFPEDQSQWSVEDFPPQKKRRTEPSYAVWNAALSLFTTLRASAKCTCHPMREFGAKLSLGTYRKPDLDDDIDDFHMFLASQQYLQEVHVQAIRDVKPVVRFALNDKDMASSRTRQAHKKEVQYLCKQMQRKKMDSMRLELQFEKGRLWKLASKRSSSRIDQEKPPVSLQCFIRDVPRSLTEKTKRILAVLLSYAVLHLHGTPWLQPTWDSSSILFFQTSSSTIPLKPFIQTPLSAAIGALGLERDVGSLEGSSSEGPDPDDVDPDDIDPDDLILHPFPALVKFAAMLMELYSATPFEMLARKYHIKGSVRSTDSIDVDLVFQRFKNDTLESSKFNYAIEKCLDPSAWEDESGQVLDSQALRVAIYQEVVRPLEDGLCDAFDTISIDELDKIAETIDFGSWCQTIQSQQDGHSTESLSPRAATVAMEALTGQRRNNATLRVPLQPSLGPTGNVFSPVTPLCEINYLGPQFFDGEVVSKDDARRWEYSTWKSRVMDVYEKFTGECEEKGTLFPVKIAVLDTGIDMIHPNLVARSDQIVEKYNWTDKNHPKAVKDNSGHGTFVANLLLDYAPGANLYVAKIAKDMSPSPPGLIAEAINHAVNKWKVDIISMSFGYPTKQLEGYDQLRAAIRNANKNQVLVFAAASNDGANADRAYPARDQNVICIHSTDAQGNRSRFSPTALTNTNNIATIGEAVESAWPRHLCDETTNPQLIEYKSGTSYSTPIGVGIATFLIQYVRLYLPNKVNELKVQMTMEAVLVRVTQREQRSEQRDGYNYLALNLHPSAFFGQDQSWIDATLAQLL